MDERIRWRLPIFSPQLITVWNWTLNLIVYALLLAIALQMNEILIYARLAPPSSLLANFGRTALTAVFLLFLVSAVHEVGHLLAGRVAGLRFHLLIIGPFKLMRDGKRISLGLHRGTLFNGLAASLPKTQTRLRGRMLLFALGGPIASLLLAGVGGGLFWELRSNPALTQDAAWLLEGTLALGIISALFFLTAMKPGHYHNGLPADGGRIATLLHGGAVADRWCALVALNGADVLGQRPRDWNADLVEQALAASDGSYDDLSAQLVGYRWALDNGCVEQAYTHLEKGLKSRVAWMNGTPAQLVLEKAYFCAYYRDDAESGRQWLERYRLGRRGAPLQHRAEAAVLLAEGNISTAREVAEAGLKALRETANTGVKKAEEAWLHAILADAYA